MTKCFEQVRLWHAWRWSCHWYFSASLSQDHTGSIQIFQRRVGLWKSASQPVTTYAAVIAGSVSSCAILHMLFIWPCDCLTDKWPRMSPTKCVDDVTVSYKGVNRVVSPVLAEAVSSMMSWLDSWLDSHLSKDVTGTEGKSVILVTNGALKEALAAPDEGVVHEGGLAPGNSVIGPFGVGAKSRHTKQCGRLAKIRTRMSKVDFYKIRCDHEQDRQGGPHAEWSARYAVHGQMWCSAGRGPHADVWRRRWECVLDTGEEAHTDSVTKCRAHLSKSGSNQSG